MSAQTSFTQFGPDPPISSLPPAFQGCLPPNAPSTYCDGVIGYAAQGPSGGYCAQDAYKQTTYCSCVNNAIPCPMIAAAACVNSAFAYTPTKMQSPNGAAYTQCKGQPICVNIVEVGGNQNVVSGITQQCGVIQNVENIVQTSPTLAVLTFLLFITLVILLSMRTGTGGKASTPPPPPPGLFGDAGPAGLPF